MSYFYSYILYLVSLIFYLMSRFHGGLRAQFEARFWSSNQWQRLEQLANSQKKKIVFYCSSAGEFEQARPILDRLRDDYLAIVLIFSQSGINFAQAQSSEEYIFKSPFDFTWTWRRFFKILKPHRVFVVRHELWPMFLKEATCPVWLINAVEHESSSLIKRYVKAKLYSQLAQIVCVDDQSYQRIVDRYGYSKIWVSGDTKYDRVRERLEANRRFKDELKEKIDTYWPSKFRLIIGSAWESDVELVSAVYKSNASLYEKWQLIVVAHDVSAANLRRITAILSRKNLTYAFWSKSIATSTVSEADVLVVDVLGILAELYACADLAFVGGATHYRVHNVLEPACLGIPISFGALYSTSQEATWLVSHKGVMVTYKECDLANWWLSKHASGQFRDPRLLEILETQFGASDRIVSRFLREDRSEF